MGVAKGETQCWYHFPRWLCLVLLVLVQSLMCAATSYLCERYLGVSLFPHVSSSLHFLDSFFNSFLCYNEVMVMFFWCQWCSFVHDEALSFVAIVLQPGLKSHGQQNHKCKIYLDGFQVFLLVGANPYILWKYFTCFIVRQTAFQMGWFIMYWRKTIDRQLQIIMMLYRVLCMWSQKSSAISCW